MASTDPSATNTPGTPEIAATPAPAMRLTQYAHGGGCACKIPPGELEQMVAGLTGRPHPSLVVGLDDGDDAAAVLLHPSDPANPGSPTSPADREVVISTADFFTPMVDSAYDWGRVAAANAMSDVWAMGGRPVLAINLLGWPRGVLPIELATEVLRGGMDVCARAGVPLAGGHSVDTPEPLYGMAVTGVGHADRLLRNDAAEPGTPISLTKPLGVGVLNNRHKATGEAFPQAVESMVALNKDAAEAALAAGIRAATDVTGFGLLGHLFKMARASGVTAVIDHAAVPYLDDVRASLEAGFVPGGSRRNLDWVRPHLAVDGAGVDEDELILLADAQTSGGLLVAGEIPGAPVIGEFVARGADPHAPAVRVR